MNPCGHGMDPAWCYPCRIEASGVPARAAWGLDTVDHEPDPRFGGPPCRDQQRELRFLCTDFGADFDGSLTEGETAIVIHSFLDESPSEQQERTLGWLCERLGSAVEPGLTYGKARSAIRRFVALRGLRSA
jgi:hypothetical protein